MARALHRREFLATSAAAAAYALSGPAFAQADDPTTLSIAAAQRLIRSGTLSPLELVEAYLERIGRFDARLNAFVTVTGERAAARARALEAELARGRWRGPLHGIPIALKDNIDTAGVLTTAASAVYADRVPDEDAEVVTRLEAAGAVILGKLNMHEFAYGGTSAFTHTGPVRNPWDVDRIPGGSSGGSGAAVAARLCAGALGTDTGGSVRIPAAHCGIVGLKPTYGLASIRGIIPLSVSLDHVGPMCRTVADAALMLQALAGYDPRGIASIRADVPDYASALLRRTSSLRLGVPRTPYHDDLDPQVAEAVDRALGVLSDLAASTRDVELPALPQARPVAVESYAYHADLLDESRELYDPSTLARIEPGAEVPAAGICRSAVSVEAGEKGDRARVRRRRPAGHADLADTPGRDRGGSRIAARSDADPDSQHGALQQLRDSRDHRPLRIQPGGSAHRGADQWPRPGRGRRARPCARLRTVDGLARTHAAAVTRTRRLAEPALVV